MATSSRHFASFDTKQASGRHRSSNLSRSERERGPKSGAWGGQSNPLVNYNVDVRTGLCVILTGGVGRGPGRPRAHFTNLGRRC